MYDQAVEVVLKTRRPSISLVQRHLRIGYNRAARLIEAMEKAGLVTPMNGARAGREGDHGERGAAIIPHELFPLRSLRAAGGAGPGQAFRAQGRRGADGLEFVEATPRGGDASFERVKIGFAANRPVSMEIHDSFGQVTVLRFTQFEPNPALPASLFRFVAPAGADVVGD
jgi:hypothetical protein